MYTFLAEASLTGDPEHIVHAVALDPLSAAVCTLKEIREMASEMLEAEREWLPQFKGKKIEPIAGYTGLTLCFPTKTIW